MGLSVSIRTFRKSNKEFQEDLEIDKNFEELRELRKKRRTVGYEKDSAGMIFFTLFWFFLGVFLGSFAVLSAIFS